MWRCNNCNKDTEPNKYCGWYCGKCGEIYEDLQSLKEMKKKKIDDFDAIFYASECQRREEESASNLNKTKREK